MDLKTLIKQLLPISLYGFLRDWKYFFSTSKKTVDCTKKHFWFIDIPEYGNLGDQAIAFAAESMLGEKFPNYEVIEINQKETIKYLRWIKKNIKKDDVIVLQGGGNFGNLYPPYEAVRRKVVASFPENRIVVLPQSCFFTDDVKGKYELKVSRKVYSNRQNLYIFARELPTYEFLCNEINGTNIRLCPDMVFYLCNRYTTSEKDGLGICFRDDKEKRSKETWEKQLINDLYHRYSNKHYLDTICPNNSIDKCTRKELVEKIIYDFAKNELVITDRLHGMIFSCITKTNCIYFDSATGKSKAVYDTWLENDYHINKALDTKFAENGSIEFNFDNLINALTV